jgi:phosphopantetheinyl transferase (holo-ACP synthase)
MKTVGIGVDIIDNKRFKNLLKIKNLLIEFSVKKKFLLQKKN